MSYAMSGYVVRPKETMRFVLVTCGRRKDSRRDDGVMCVASRDVFDTLESKKSLQNMLPYDG